MTIKLNYFEPIITRAKKQGLADSYIRQELFFAVNTINGNPALGRCTRDSLFTSVFEALTLGLTLNPAVKFGFLIPRYTAEVFEAQFQPSYQGLVHLAMKEGSLRHITVHNVHEDDYFTIDLAQGDIHHQPALKNRGEIVGTYGIATDQYEYKTAEYMTVEEIHQVRDMSESYKAFKSGRTKQSPWDQWFGEMARKSLIKRMFKYLPKSPDSPLAQAIEVDNRDYRASLKQIGLIESLLKWATISDADYDSISRQLTDMSVSEASRTIQFLKDNQLNPLHRGSMSAAEIMSAVNDKLNDPNA